MNAAARTATWSNTTSVVELTLRASVLSLLDSDPPYSNQVARFQARSYDDRYSNPLGRTWTLAGRYEF